MEDVNNIYEKAGRKEMYYLIDSRFRNIKRFPEPNNYMITFDNPIKNVYSFNIVNASIPRTQYAIDNHTNMLEYTYDNNVTANVIQLDIGDYNSVLLIEEINTRFAENGTPITMDNLSNPATKRNIFVFKSDKPFTFHVTNSTLGETLGFGPVGEFEGAMLDTFYDTTTISYESASEFTFGIKDDHLLYSKFSVENDGSLNNIKIRLRALHDVTAVVSIMTENSDGREIISGSTHYFQVLASSALEEYTIPFPSGEDAIGLVAGSTYYVHLYFIYTDSDDSDETYIYVNTFVNDTENTLEYKVNGMEDVSIQRFSYVKVYNEATSSLNLQPLYTTAFGKTDEDESENPTLLTLDIKIEVNVHNYALEAPGMYSLIGDTYLKLRCPEIETHMYNSYALDKYAIGISKFTINSFGYTQSTFNLMGSFERKFHPIGKLAKLTFMFERPDGELYNFRKVEHQMTIQIKYYEMENVMKFDKSLLNPEYTQNYMNYVQSESDNGDSSDEN